MTRRFRCLIPFVACAVALLVSTKAFSQAAYQPLDQEAYRWLDRFEIRSGRFLPNIYTSNKPYSRQDIVTALQSLDTMATKPKWSNVDLKNMEWLRVDNDEWSKDTAARSRKPILHTFYKKKANFYSYNDMDFMVKVDPVIEFGLGYEKGSTIPGRKFVNTRGIELRGWISRKVGFYFYAADNQMRPPDYVIRTVNKTVIFDSGYTQVGQVPYAGYYKNFKETGFDFFNARGYITFKPIKPITVAFGTDRNFVGNGERSLFLSNFSNEYLFLKLQTKVWKLDYTNLFIEGIENYDHFEGDKLLSKRFATFHHLSLNATRWLNLGLFEGIVFTRSQGFELHYLNPIIFLRPTENYLGSDDNALIGVDGKINLVKHVSLYAQFILDDLNVTELRKFNGYWGNKFGAQAGMKYIDAFTVKNLDLQGEINVVRPYTYTHSDTTNSYTNYNLPLAHPLGANFYEVLGVIRFQPIQQLTVTLKAFYDLYGRDSALTNYGGNIRYVTTPFNIEHTYDNAPAQGYRVKQALATANVAYEIRHNLFIDLYAVYRYSKQANITVAEKTQYGQLAIRWNIPPRRHEF